MRTNYKYYYLFLSLMLLMFSEVLMGQNPSTDEIRAVVDRHIAINFPKGSWGLESIEIIGAQSEAGVYLIDLSPEGWILISGDKRAEAVLAFSSSGNFIIEENGVQTPSMEWISSYTREVESVRGDRDVEINRSWLGGSEEKSASSVMEGVTVKPFITAMWNQGKGWNEQCPEDAAGPNGHVLVGCVAVAIAQAISVYDYPITGTGEHSYTHITYGNLTVDYSVADYDWDNMSDLVPDENNSQLLYHCAVGVDMDFGPSSSGASTGKSLSLLRNNYLFSPQMRFISKESFSDEVWGELLNQQLLKGFPIIYRGESVDGKSAHAFNIDGVKNNDFYHFNWGWGGSNNGYYVLTALTPGTRNYSTDQWAIINIKPYYYPTGISLSNYIVPKNLAIGSDVGDIEVLDEASDNEYEIILKTDSTFINGFWEMDYKLEGNRLKTGVSLSDNPNITDTIWITVNDAHGNRLETEIILLLGIATGSDEILFDQYSDVMVYPNPAGDYLSISGGDNFEAVSIKIYSSAGQTVLSRNVNPGEPIDISGLNSGIYILEAVSSRGSSLIRKVIKN